MQSFVRVDDGEPFIIAGLSSSRRLEGKSGVPGLSKIPGLGALFRRTRKAEQKNELVIVVTPHVINAEAVELGRLRPNPQLLEGAWPSDWSPVP